ncbi:MAG TPA: hypothetical protein VJ023_12775 [Pyrinomonadaceae bacterium]|nr:hypothetical protein [Pyrinomonadaceae bacterium]
MATIQKHGFQLSFIIQTTHDEKKWAVEIHEAQYENEFLIPGRFPGWQDGI